MHQGHIAICGLSTKHEVISAYTYMANNQGMVGLLQTMLVLCRIKEQHATQDRC